MDNQPVSETTLQVLLNKVSSDIRADIKELRDELRLLTEKQAEQNEPQA